MKSLFPKGKWFPRKGLPSPSIIYEINSFLMKVVPLSALEKMEHFGENFCSFLALLNGNSTTLSKWWCNLQKLFILVVALQKRLMGPARRWLPNSWKTSTDATVDKCKKIGRNLSWPSFQPQSRLWILSSEIEPRSSAAARVDSVGERNILLETNSDANKLRGRSH